MIYVLLSVLSSSGIFVLFKLFKHYNVNTLQAIVVNYITACVLGIVCYNGTVNVTEITRASWFYAAIGLGLLFISIFNVMALTAQINGLSVASVASKMSVIIPVIFGVLVLRESVGIQKLLGIVLALVAVYFASVKSKDSTMLTRSIYLPIILFVGSGVIETALNYFAPDGALPLFSAIIFGAAFCCGALLLLYKWFWLKSKFQVKSISSGLLLGVVNYASIYFLLKALRIDGAESSSIFTINNVAIVTLSTFIGLLVFKEDMSQKNWVGVGIAVLSIMLVTLS